jgi:hypothetical protein
MALDYSKLSDAELEAIANDDYSKLSDATLQAISSEGQPSSGIDASILAPQALGVAKGLAGAIAPAAEAAYNVGKNIVGYPLDVARNAMAWTPASVAQVVTNPISTAKAYLSHHPTVQSIMNSNASLASVGKQAAQGALPFAKNVATSVGAGLAAPESALLMPYQMAAYEQEKIRANPTAPEYATNPYAQMTRGEYATQGQAGAANRRQAIAGQQYGGLNESEQRILDQDRINMAIRLRAAKKVLGPVAPTGQ